jgi:hypothetical protein
MPTLSSMSTGRMFGTGTRSDEPVVEWRRLRLAEAGFDEALARELARAQGMDLHALLDLAARGCPPALAVRILAPLDDSATGTGRDSATRRRPDAPRAGRDAER